MNTTKALPLNAAWVSGLRDATPLLGGYIPVAISFGLIAVQSGFKAWEAVLISLLIYAGASQFLFVALIASGAPLWLVVTMTLLINFRHVVYGPNIAPYLSRDAKWTWLMHGLTDQIFALAHTRLPQMPESERMGWYTGAMMLAWMSWVFGTGLGAVAGEELIHRWPLLKEAMPFALPALFLVLLAPRFSTRVWSIALGTTIAVAMILKLAGLTNAAIPLAAFCGSAFFFLASKPTPTEGHQDGQ